MVGAEGGCSGGGEEGRQLQGMCLAAGERGVVGAWQAAYIGQTCRWAPWRLSVRLDQRLCSAASSQLQCT